MGAGVNSGIKEEQENREFLETIRFFHRRIHIADFLGKLVSALFVGAGVGILFQAAAFVIPLYYAGLYAVLAVLLAAAAAFAVAVLKRCSMREAALVMDGFGFKERIVTAYEHLGEEGEMIALQRRDAMEQLQAHKERIHIRLLPAKGKLAALAGMLLLLPVLALVPSAVKERAEELHFLKKEAKEKVEEIKEALEGLEALEEQGGQELTEEQLAALQEMMDSLKSSISEYQQAVSAEAMAAAGAKLDFKYGEMANQLSQLAGSLQGNPAVSVSAAQTAAEVAQRFQEMSGMPGIGNGSMVADGGNGTGDGSGSGQGSDSGNGTGDGTGDGSGNGTGNGTGDGQGDGSGGGTGSGTGDGQGDGSGGGTGSGSGNGTGDGSGNGTGDGTGSGSGRGTGSSSAVHDYVSVPNAVADSGNLTGSASNHEDSDYFRTQNGLNWEGEHISHEAVIGSYEKKAYEGISAGRYPEGMEEVIKGYFSSF